MHLHLIALTRKKIDQIIVSQYILEDPYAITCSEEDNSIREWLKRTDNNNRRVRILRLEHQFDRPMEFLPNGDLMNLIKFTGFMTQWDLSTMTFETQYHLVDEVDEYDEYDGLVITKLRHYWRYILKI
uniref:Uncharacterized protein n=1 Tax=Rhizophagus irregularis (strain DAOM 181602 / DAOM 197198 / MUCL 43194) TaxID=747089 RepID=U9T1G9_RHIID